MGLPYQFDHPDHLAAGEAAICAVYPDARNPFTFTELAAEGLEAGKTTIKYKDVSIGTVTKKFVIFGSHRNLPDGQIIEGDCGDERRGSGTRQPLEEPLVYDVDVGIEAR